MKSDLISFLKHKMSALCVDLKTTYKIIILGLTSLQQNTFHYTCQAVLSKVKLYEYA